MTTHFLSFIGDIIFSGVIGMVVAYVMNRPTRLSLMDKVRDSIFMSIIAMVCGVFLTLNYALPEEGIAGNILFLVFFMMFSGALVHSRRFRNDTLQKCTQLLQSFSVLTHAV